MNKRLSFLVILVVLFVTTFVASFITPTTAQITPPETMGELRVVNGLVGLGPVDVYLNDKRLAYGLMPEAATTYVSLPAGRYAVAVRQAGADPFSVPIADILVDLAQEQSLTAIAYQKQFATETYTPPHEQSGAIHVVVDDRAPVTPGKTRLTAVHLAVGAPESLSIGYPRALLLDGIRLEQPFGSVDTEAGLYSLTLGDAAGTSQNILERVGEQSLYANTVYTLVVVPNLDYSFSERTGEPEMNAATTQPHLFLVSAPTHPPKDGMRLRLINTAFEIPTFDVYIDGKLTAARMGYGDISEYLGLPGYRHRVTLRRAGSSVESQPLAETSFFIPPDSQPQKDWTLLLVNGNVVNEAALRQVQSVDTSLPTITNTPDNAVMMALLPDNLSQTAANQSRLRVLHTVENLPPISLFTPDTVEFDPLPGLVATPTLRPTHDPMLGAPPLVSLVNRASFGAVASETEVRAGIYDELNLLLDGTGSDIQTVPSVHFVPGMIYTYVVMGSTSGNPPIEVVPITDYGRGLPFFRPGQQPTPTIAPVVVTRIPPTPTLAPAQGNQQQPAAPPPQSGGSSGGDGGSGGGSGGGGGGGSTQPTAPPPPPPTSMPPTPVPPTPVPPTQEPPTQEPPTAEPPSDPPPSTEPAPPPPEAPGIIPPILETLVPPIGDILGGLGGLGG